jgi:hypothetical protein
MEAVPDLLTLPQIPDILSFVSFRTDGATACTETVFWPFQRGVGKMSGTCDLAQLANLRNATVIRTLS